MMFKGRLCCAAAHTGTTVPQGSDGRILAVYALRVWNFTSSLTSGMVLCLHEFRNVLKNSRPDVRWVLLTEGSLFLFTRSSFGILLVHLAFVIHMVVSCMVLHEFLSVLESH